MREVTASEASRNFSALLDAVEQGESVIVTRSGYRVAAVTPAPRSNGAAVREVLARWQGHAHGDTDLAERVAAARAGADGELDSDPWHD